MKLYLDAKTFIETSLPIDLSIGLSNTLDNPRAWYVDPPSFEPVRTEHYVGSVAEGGVVNFRDIAFNPHGHGTHTECLGHITEKVHSVNAVLKEFMLKARVISVQPKEVQLDASNVDWIIQKDQLELANFLGDALIIRTLPNDSAKKRTNYSESNPPYLDVECAEFLLKQGVKHLLIDLPSVDKENDGGVLAFHHRFWEVPENPNFERTITELIFVPNEVEDGDYVLELQVAPFENDAAPSRPVLYRIQKERIQ